MIDRRVAMLGLAAVCATCNPEILVKLRSHAVDLPSSVKSEISLEAWRNIGSVLRQGKSGPNFGR